MLILRCCAMQPVPTWRVAVAISVTHHWLLATTSDAMAFSPRKREDWLDPLIDVCRRNRALVKGERTNREQNGLERRKDVISMIFFLQGPKKSPQECFRKLFGPVSGRTSGDVNRRAGGTNYT